MDWTRSGILNRFEFEMVDARNVNLSRGYLSKVTGGKITETYRGDYRSSASIDVSGGQVPLDVAVRIWHVAELDGETVREELGTFWPEPDRYTYERGYYTGTLSMYSAMKRLGTDIKGSATVVAKGTDPVSYFRKVVSDSGGVASVADNIPKGRRLSKAHTWNFGESALKECQRLADAVGGWIGVDTHGRVVLTTYVKPSKRAVSYTIPTGGSSITYMGVGVTIPKMYNRFIASYTRSYKVTKNGKTTTQKKTYYRDSRVPDSHPWSFGRIKRWYTYKCNPPTFATGAEVTEAQAVNGLKTVTDRAMGEHADVRRTYGASMLYTPRVRVGGVVNFAYDDGGGALRFKGFVAQREISLDGEMKMDVTLEEL